MYCDGWALSAARRASDACGWAGVSVVGGCTWGDPV